MCSALQGPASSIKLCTKTDNAITTVWEVSKPVFRQTFRKRMRNKHWVSTNTSKAETSRHIEGKKVGNAPISVRTVDSSVNVDAVGAKHNQ